MCSWRCFIVYSGYLGTSLFVFISTALAINGLAFYAKTKNRSAFWGLFGFLNFGILMGFPSIAGLLMLLFLKKKENKDALRRKITSGVAFILIGITIILISLFVSFSVLSRQKAMGREAYNVPALFLSGAFYGYLFYLAGLNGVIEKKE